MTYRKYRRSRLSVNAWVPDMTIVETNLSKRAKRVLADALIVTFEDLLEQYRDERYTGRVNLLRLPYCGPKTADEIEKFLREEIYDPSRNDRKVSRAASRR
jgi:endonuclease III